MDPTSVQIEKADLAPVRIVAWPGRGALPLPHRREGRTEASGPCDDSYRSFTLSFNTRKQLLLIFEG